MTRTAARKRTVSEETLKDYTVREVASGAAGTWPRSYHVHAIKDKLIVASAEATDMEDHWLVNRCVVLERRGAPRGAGLGSALLQKLLTGIVLCDMTVPHRETTVYVDPGGYGANPRKQMRFYEHNGFVKTATPGRLMWKPLRHLPRPLKKLTKKAWSPAGNTAYLTCPTCDDGTARIDGEWYVFNRGGLALVKCVRCDSEYGLSEIVALKPEKT